MSAAISVECLWNSLNIHVGGTRTVSELEPLEKQSVLCLSLRIVAGTSDAHPSLLLGVCKHLFFFTRCKHVRGYDIDDMTPKDLFAVREKLLLKVSSNSL